MNKYLGLILIIFFFACIKEDFDNDKLSKKFSVDSDNALPIGYTSFSLQDYIDKNDWSEHLYVDETGFMSFVFNATDESITAAEIIKLQGYKTIDTVKNKEKHAIDLRRVETPYSFSIKYPLKIDIENNGDAQLDSIKLKSGIFSIKLETLVSLNGFITIHFDSIFADNIPYTKTVSLNTENIFFDLEGKTIFLKRDSENNDVIYLNLNITLNNSNSRVASGKAFFVVEAGLSNLIFDVIYGYVGNQTFSCSPNSIELDVFDYIEDGYFHFDHISAKFDIKNSVGAPLAIVLTDYKAINQNGDEMDISGDSEMMPGNSKIINYPVEDRFYYVFDSTLVNTTEITLGSALEISPSYLSYSIEGTLNPENTDTKNIIYSNSKYIIDSEYIVPVWGYTKRIVMQDTLNFNFEELFGDKIEDIDKLTFDIFTENLFPFEILPQAYFIDENYNIIDSIFTNRPLIEAGIDENNSGKNNKTVASSFKSTFDKKRIENILSAKQIIVEGWFRTSGCDSTPPISHKIYTDYYCDLKLGTIVTLVR